MKKLTIFALMFLLMFSLASALTYDGDTVTEDNNKGTVSVTPHTIYGSDTVYIDFLSKQYTGDVNILFGFNGDIAQVNGDIPKPSKFEYYNHNIIEKSYTCTESFNYTTNPNYFWCYEVLGNGTVNIIYEHSFISGDIPAKTATWEEPRGWLNVPVDNWGVINYTIDNKDTWFYTTGIPITQGVEYKARFKLDVPSYYGLKDYTIKYDYAFYPSSYGSNVIQAYQDGAFMFIDPVIYLNSVVNEDDFNRSNGGLNGQTATNGNTWTADAEYTTLNNHMELEAGAGKSATLDLINNTPYYTAFRLLINGSVADGTNIGFRDGASYCTYTRWNGGNWQYRASGGSWNNAYVGWSADTWYYVEYKNIDFTTDTYDIWVDQVQKVTGATFWENAGECSNFDDIDFYSTAGVEIAFDALSTDNQTGSAPPTPSSYENLTINVYNDRDNSQNINFSVNVTNGSVSYSYTGLDTIVTDFYLNVTDNFNISVYNAYTNDRYFLNKNVSRTVSNATYLVNISLEPYTKVTINDTYNISPLDNFNVTFNAVVYNSNANGEVYLPSYNTSINILIEKTGYYDKTVTYNSSLDLNTNLTPYTKIYAKFIDNNATISNFTITYDGKDYITTSGVANVPIFNETVNISLKDAYPYANDIKEVTASPYLENYTFYLYPANSVRIFMRDIDTGNLITENITIAVLGSSGLNTYYSDIGKYNLTLLSPDNYTITFSSENYTTVNYPITVTNGSTQVLNAYLTRADASVIFYTKSQNTGEALQGALYTISTVINSTWTVINTKYSDVAGQIRLDYNSAKAYRFSVTLSGYTSKSFELDPIIGATYTIWLEDASPYTQEQAYTGINVLYYVNPYFLDNNITFVSGSFKNSYNNNFTIQFSAPQGDLTSYGYNLTYKGKTISGSGINAYGELLNDNLTITGAQVLDTVTLVYYYTSSVSGYQEFRAVFSIGLSNSTGLMTGLQDYHYGLGVLERVLIVIIIAGIFGGLIGLFNGLLAGGFASAFIMAYFIFTHFLEVWFLALPIVLLFMLILWRGE